MQAEQWIMIAKFRHELYFADFLGYKGYSFLNNNQHYKQIMRAPLQFHPSLSGFHTIHAALHPFMFRQVELTGVHDVIVLFL